MLQQNTQKKKKTTNRFQGNEWEMGAMVWLLSQWLKMCVMEFIGE